MRRLLALFLAAPALCYQDPPSVLDWTTTLEEGAWQLSLRADIASADGLRDGREELDQAALSASGYSRFTSDLDRRELTLRLAHGVAGCTLFAALPVAEIRRKGNDAPATPFDEKVQALGDLEFGLTKHYRRGKRDALLASVALSLPTGGFDEDGVPYPLQVGGGTFDLWGAAAWIRRGKALRYGLALRGRVPLNENDQGWARSRSLVTDLWVARSLNSRLWGRLGLRNTSFGDIYGRDPDLDPSADPLADPKRQGGSRTDLLAGFSWLASPGKDPVPAAPGSSHAGGDLRLEFEFGLPIDEWLDGPGPSNEYTLSVGLRYGF